MNTRVLVLYNAPTLPPGHPDAASEAAVVETAQAVAKELIARRFQVRPFGLTDDPAPLLEACRQDRPDVVFNLYEGLANRGGTEAYVAGLLELLRIPYTGCPFQALVLARDKPSTKRLLLGSGLPTPAFRVVRADSDAPTDLRWPVIVKTATEDASVGIDHGSVATSPEAVRRRIHWLGERYPPPFIVEEFLGGREFNVAVAETPTVRALPISEIVFQVRPAGDWPLVTYEAKWVEGSADDLATVPRCPADVTPELASELTRIALEAFQLLGCRQFARVDLRLCERGRPHVLEVNPNPDYHPDAGFARALKAAGINHGDFTAALVRQAMNDALKRNAD